MLANSTDGAPTPPKPYPAFGMQALGLLAGLLCGLALGGGAIYVLNENNVSPGSTVARFLLAIECLRASIAPLPNFVDFAPHREGHRWRSSDRSCQMHKAGRARSADGAPLPHRAGRQA